jgi:hypothetical protein
VVVALVITVAGLAIAPETRDLDLDEEPALPEGGGLTGTAAHT